jgi:hypothetical protein
VNISEGLRRLVIALAILSICSVGFVTWTWIRAEIAWAESNASMEKWLKLDGSGTPAEAAARDESDAADNYMIRLRKEFTAARLWVVWGHIIVGAMGLLGWAAAGLCAPSKLSLTTREDPARLTGSADTGPPADKEG